MKLFKSKAVTSVAASFFWVAAIAIPSAGYAAADLGVSPLSLSLPSKTLATSLVLVNQGAQPVTVSAELMAWSQKDGKDMLSPSGDLVVSPPLFTVTPGQQQVVRVGRIARSEPPQVQASYRLVLTEIPAPKTAVSTVIGTALRLSVPLMVPPAKPDAAPLVWAATPQAVKGLTVKITNPANHHQLLSKVSVQQNGEVIAEKTVNITLLAGASDSFTWPDALKMTRAGVPIELVGIVGKNKESRYSLEFGAVSIVPTQ